MSEISFTPDSFMNRLYGEFYNEPYKNALTQADALAVSFKIREGLRNVFAIDRIPLKCSREPVFLERDIDRGEYFQSKLSLEILDGLHMLCYLLVPKKVNQSRSGVVALCGHGYGVRQIIGQGKNGKKRIIPFLDGYQKNFASALAERGNIVIAPELIGFGEAREEKDKNKHFYASSCEALSHKLLTYGLTIASLRIYQTMRCVDLLIETGRCNPQKIGCMGISGGGLTALYTAALDNRISDIVVSGYVNTFKDSILSVWHCPDNFFPGILQVGEIYDIASSLAPRRLLLECGEKDRIFPIEGSKTAIENISRVYTLFGAEDKFDYDIFAGKHKISGKKSFAFFGG